jgi:aerobic carbon-monoxide dehydrogenase medium subunit
VYPAPFEYLVPDTVPEAIDLLRQHGDEAMVLAGGQSLIPMMHLRVLQPSYLVDLNALGDGSPRREGDTVVFPALTRQRVVERHPLIRNACPILADAVGFIGNVRVRSRGTVGGNLAHADPSSELICAALASGGVVRVAGPSGERIVGLDELLVTYMTTSLQPAELVTELRVRAMGARTGWAFLEMARRAGEFAIANVAALVTLDENRRRVANISLVLGGVSDRVVDVTEAAAEAMVNEIASSEAFRGVAEHVTRLVDPRDDVHASAHYRRDVVRVFSRRALELAYRRALDESAQR